MPEWKQIGDTFEPEPNFEIFDAFPMGRRGQPPPLPAGFITPECMGEPEKNKNKRKKEKNDG